LIERNESALVNEWLALLGSAVGNRRTDRLNDVQVQENARSFLAALRQGLSFGNLSDLSRSEWNGMHDLLKDLSRQRAERGYTPSETATFVFSFKQPLFTRLRKEFGNNLDAFTDEVWRATNLVDRLGLETMDAFQKILEAVVSYGAAIAIIDITGVPTVDTLVAQHLLKTVAAARLMGADCIISGIRPQIAQTIIHLGVDLSDVVTKATLADAFQLALRKLGLGIAAETTRSERG
jgi:rsbT co-antagonist protein RsbR